MVRWMALEISYTQASMLLFTTVTEIYLHIVEKCLFLFGMILIELGCIGAPGEWLRIGFRRWFDLH